MRRYAPRTRSLVRHGLIALASVAGAMLIRLLFMPLLGTRVPLVTYPIAVLVAGYFGGLWSGLLATVFGLVAAAFLFIEPLHTLNWLNSANGVSLALYGVGGVFTSLVCEALRNSRRRAELNAESLRRGEEALRRAHHELEHRVETRTLDLSRANENLQLEIAERRQAEEALRQSRELLQAVVEGTSDAVYVKDPDGRYLLFNTAAARFTGKRVEDAIGKDDTFLFPLDEAREIMAGDRAVMAAGKTMTYEEHVTDAKGRRLTFHSTKGPLYDGHGKLSGLFGIARDLTDLKQAEEALGVREETLRQVVRVSDLGVFDHDQRTDIIQWSPKMREICGWSATEHPDLPSFLTRVHPDDRERIAAAIQRAHDPGSDGLYTVEHRLVRPDSNITRWLSVRAQTFFETVGGRRRPVRTIGVALDITERKRAEEALRAANDALAEADRRKDEFLAMLAHELRNPLAPVRTAVQVMRIKCSPDPALARQRDIIDRQVNHMARLVDDLLDVTRITRGRIELKKQVLHLAEAMVQAVELATPLIEARRQKLSLALPPGDLCLEADPDRLAQAIGNLLANAAKYTPEDGQIWLEASRACHEAVIRVRDTGVGIAPEMLPRIFELFAQADQGLARSQGGLGIGLTMARQLVEMHGGTVEAHSEGLGKGSEFIIRLPATADKEPTSAWATIAGEEIHEAPLHRILVVDDIVDTADSLAEMLSLAGHEVRSAYDGPAALKMYCNFRPDVVILDIGMPGMDGYEVARRMSQLETGRKALLVALTGYAQDCDRAMACQAGFDHHLAKPVNLAALRELLAQPLAQPRPPASNLR